MSDLLAARSQMGISLAFHIIFAVVGIGMPALMVLAEWRAQRTGDAMYLELAKRWSKGTAILFAVGAVSGTVLSFELGLLWPSFMEFAGPIIGMPFSLEGFAFFTEAIFLGIYLYGWNRISPKAHLWSGVAVAVSGMISGVFVVMANAWMNAPAGFELVQGKAVHVDPIAALFNAAVVQQTLHMTIASYCATGMAVAGIHAVLLLKHPGDRFHRAALMIALWVGVPAALLQPESGHFSAQWVAERQPVKLAAMEGQFLTEVGAPLRIGGIPDESTFETRGAIEVPYGLSILAFNDPFAEVKGLDSVPRDQWPPVAIVHVAFQIMVALGTLLSLAASWVAWRWFKKRPVESSRPLLWCLVLCTPLGFLAIEAGWIVTEVGRQPWIIYKVLRTSQAVTPMPGLIWSMTGFSLLYLFLAVIVTWLLYSQILRTVPNSSAYSTDPLP
jgi:cytochrome bd ubiquinol oxidase subunit I